MIKNFASILKPNSFEGFLYNNSSPRMVRFFLFSLAVLFPIQSLKVDLQVGKQLTQIGRAHV